MNKKTYIRCLTAALTMVLCAPCMMALSTDYYASASKLASGKWVKIRVDEPGMYEITYAELKAMGFSDPSKVTVWGYGGAQLTENTLSESLPDDLHQQYCYYYTTPANEDLRKVIFYGVGPVRFNVKSETSLTTYRNIYSNSGYYFLTDTQDKKIATTVPLKTSGRTTLTNHVHLEYLEKDSVNLAEGGTYFFGDNIAGTTGRYSIPVKYVSASGSFWGTLLYVFGTDYKSNVKLGFNSGNGKFKYSSGNYAELPSGSAYSDIITFTRSTVGQLILTYDSTVTDDTWDFYFTPPTTTSTLNYAGLDYVALLYCRDNKLPYPEPQVSMWFRNVAAGTHNFKVSNATSIMQAWDVNDPTNVRVYSGVYSSSAQTIEYSFDKTYSSSLEGANVVAFVPSRDLNKVTVVGDVPNQNLHGEAVPDMVIIVRDKLRSQAERLAALHEKYQGMTVRVITPEEIYNEFSSGTPSASGIRRYLKMNYDRDPQKFKHVLLFGLGSWDNRHISVPDDDHIITYQVESVTYARDNTRCYATDAYFGMLSDDMTTDKILTAKMDINVSRMPVNNISDAKVAVDKIETYFADPPVGGTYNHALYFCDDGEKNDHLTQADQAAESIKEAAPSVTVSKLYNALYPWDDNDDAVVLREAMKMQLSRGQTYVGYCGHGSSNGLGYDQHLYTLSAIKSNTYNVMPFWMLSTCNAYRFDAVANDLACNLIRQENGGAIAVVAACRAVYKQHNQELNMGVVTNYFNATSGMTTGDVFRLGRNGIIDDTKPALAVNTLCYNMAGDPALPIYVPTLKVQTTRVNQVDITSATESVSAYPLQPFTIHGTITDADGNVQTDFNGVVSIDIYDGDSDVLSSLKGEPSGTSQVTVHLDETLLAQAKATVTNGQFATSVTVPTPNVPDANNRIGYYAANEGHTLFAAGSFELLNVTNYDESKITDPDTVAPEITALYLDDETFVSGDETGPSPVMYATVAYDRSGFNVSDGKIGMGARLILDGNTTYPAVATALEIEDDGGASARVALSGLSDGYHTLEFSIADNAGNRSSRTIGFIVINRTAEATLAVDEATARMQATLTLEHAFEDAPTGRLIIEDADGNTVFSRENVSFPYTWDLNDASGVRVADGRYRAYAVLSCDKQYGNTPRVEIVVIK